MYEYLIHAKAKSRNPQAGRRYLSRPYTCLEFLAAASLSDIVCPVMCLHVSLGISLKDELGQKCAQQQLGANGLDRDAVYSVENTQEIKPFTNSAHADLVAV